MMLYVLIMCMVIAVAIGVFGMPWPVAVICTALGVGCGMIADRN